MTYNQTRLVGALACALLVFYIFAGTDLDEGFTILNIIQSFIAAFWAMMFATFAFGDVNK